MMMSGSSNSYSYVCIYMYIGIHIPVYPSVFAVIDCSCMYIRMYILLHMYVHLVIYIDNYSQQHRLTGRRL